MLIRKNFKLIGLASAAALIFIFGSVSAASAQEKVPPPRTDNLYEEPWHPASRFAVKEGGKREKASITLVKINDAKFTAGETGLDFNICMEVKYKKGRKKAVTRYALTNVFRDDKTMAYTLRSWALSKTPPNDCQ